MPAWPCQVIPCQRMAKHAVHHRHGAVTIMTVACDGCLDDVTASPTEVLRVVPLSTSIPPPAPAASGVTQVALPARRMA